jgi:DNA adenine methylase
MVRYFGGKGVHGKSIAEKIINDIGEENLKEYIYMEPFCGALGVLKHMVKLNFKKVYGNDLNKDIITLWKEVQKGTFKNPKITRNKWLDYKYSKVSSPERTFAGYGCSFGGVWFNGYICDNGNNDMQYNTINKIKESIREVVFSNEDYEKFITSKIKEGKKYIIYMDPPYNKTTAPKQWGEFDTKKFWDLVCTLSKNKNIKVYVSEFTGPTWCKLLYKFERRSGMHNTTKYKQTVVEKLYKC